MISPDLLHDLALSADPALFFASATGRTPDGWQAQLLRSTAHRVIVVGCRQAGKSSVLASVALHQALTVPGSTTLLAAPSLEQSSELFSKVMEQYRSLGEPLPADRSTVQEIRFSTGSRIRALQANATTVRGYTADLLLLDEAAYTEDQLFHTITPMLIISQGRMIACSTPYGRLGWFYDQFTGDDDTWQRLRFTAHDIQRISAQELERQRRMLGPTIFAQEYLAEFTDRQFQVFAGDLIDAAIDETIEPLDIASILSGIPLDRVGWDVPAIGDPEFTM